MSRSTSRRPTEEHAATIPPPGQHPPGEYQAERCGWLSRRRFLHAGAAALGSALMPAYSAGAQQTSRGISTTDLGGVTLLQGAGCNVIAMPGTDPKAGD